MRRTDLSRFEAGSTYRIAINRVRVAKGEAEILSKERLAPMIAKLKKHSHRPTDWPNLLKPIVVTVEERYKKKHFCLVEGVHRYNLLMSLGLTLIRCKIYDPMEFFFGPANEKD